MNPVHAPLDQAREPREAPAAEAGARELYDQLAAAPAAPDWEQLIAIGAVPALALGAERRLHRH